VPDDFADPRSRRARLALCKKQLEERAARENMAVIALEASQTIEVVRTDAGYISEENLAGIDPDGPEYLIATKNGWKQRGKNEGGRLVGCPILSPSEIGWRASCSRCGACVV